jgi:pimeloyl-ACP methyl ester carboxylesterase
VEYFTPQGYACFRFNFYSPLPQARTLHTSCIQTHSQDLEKILEHFSPLFEEIYLIGHSLGGPSITGITHIPENVKKVILWDPVMDLQNL